MKFYSIKLVSTYWVGDEKNFIVEGNKFRSAWLIKKDRES